MILRSFCDLQLSLTEVQGQMLDVIRHFYHFYLVLVYFSF